MPKPDHWTPSPKKPKPGCDPCCDYPNNIIITDGVPECPPNPCVSLPIAYDAAGHCFYLWTQNIGWFEASGVDFDAVAVEDKTIIPENDHWVSKVCTDYVDIYNSRNSSLTYSAATKAVSLAQTYGADFVVSLKDLDTYVDTLTYDEATNVITMTQTQGRGTKTVDLTELDSYVTTFSYDATTNKITLNQNQSKGNFSVDLTELDSYVTTFSYDESTNKIILNQNQSKGNFSVDLTELDSYLSGLTLSGNTLTAAQTQGKGSVTVDLSALDSYLSGLTLSGNTLTAAQTQGKGSVTVDLSALDSYLSGLTLSGNTLTAAQTQGKGSVTVDLSGLNSTVSGLTLSAAGVLTLTQSEGGATRTVDLSGLNQHVDGMSITGAGTAASPFKVNFDRICNDAESVSSPDGYNVLLCGSSGVKKVDAGTFFQEACFNDVPDAGDVCGTSYQLILYDDDGCTRLAKVTDSTESNFYGGPWQVLTPVDQGGLNFPEDFPTANVFYSTTDYVTDGGNNSSAYNGGQYGSNLRAASGLNGTKISNARVARITGEITCATLYEFSISAIVRQPSTVDLAYTRKFTFGRRIRYSQDGGSTWTPWLYWKNTGATGDLGVQTTTSSLEGKAVIDYTDTRMYPGTFELEVFYLAGDASDTDKIGIVGANTYSLSTGNPSPKVSMVRKY